MSTNKKTVVVGLGEIGKPLFQLLSTKHEVVGVDVSPVAPVDNVDLMHVCYPFQIKDFIGETARYMELYHPELTVINSTVSVGTTRAIAERTGKAVVNSPVRGKHVRMLQEIQFYTKFVGAIDPIWGEKAAQHFNAVGMKTKILTTPEATELAKLTETTYFGLMIAWAQELERYCDKSGANYEEIISFYDEIKFFPPVKYFPGLIGGHCVMPNIAILKSFTDSMLLNAIQDSNAMKVERDGKLEGAPSTTREAEKVAV